ncbi:protein IQ-DOMAIN 32 [Sesamum alatum]|uniref:Protein IQ-DOMAIN 32 n=1 Tax=Sesamum alatum TaxID=300844 RepID=A0AAE1YQ99_9LAMI|nr:protein IQ-DOMAIN 32 [Sesamum alatum]
MGKPTASCFRIISCGSDSVNHDDFQSLQSKASSNRYGWSFRKRYAGHRVLTNSIISESLSSANKESPEGTAVNCPVQPNLTVPLKTSVMQQTEEKNKLCAQSDLDLSDVIASREDHLRSDAILDESSIIVIQAAIRRYLAQRVLLKQKKITKLQAAVRGHLVRRQAVGTLQCVQAIVKMQTLVRARRARLLVEGSGNFEKQNENGGKDNLNPTPLVTTLS